MSPGASGNTGDAPAHSGRVRPAGGGGGGAGPTWAPALAVAVAVRGFHHSPHPARHTCSADLRWPSVTHVAQRMQNSPSRLVCHHHGLTRRCDRTITPSSAHATPRNQSRRSPATPTWHANPGGLCQNGYGGVGGVSAGARESARACVRPCARRVLVHTRTEPGTDNAIIIRTRRALA